MPTILFDDLDDLSSVASQLPRDGVLCYPTIDATGTADGTHTLVVPDELLAQALALKDDLPAARKAELLQYARQVSWQVRQAGAPVNGARVATDPDSLTLINGMASLAQLQPDRTFNFDTPDGPVAMSAAQAVAFAAEVGAFVQSTFDRRAEVLVKIERGTILSKEDIVAAFADL